MILPLNPPALDPAGVTLAVLAGGIGSRMGFPKGGLVIDGRPILQILVDRLRWPGPTMLVTAPGREDPPGSNFFDRQVVDSVVGQGPLRGLLTALESATTDLVVVTTVDMPGVTQDVLLWIAARSGTVGAMTSRTTDGRVQIEPFPSVFRVTARDPVRKKLAADRRSVHGLCDVPGVELLPSPPSWPVEVWSNLNTPSDVSAYAKGRHL